MSAQQKTDPRLWWVLGAAAVASLAWLAVTAGLIGSAMDAQERQAVLQTVGDRLVLQVEPRGPGRLEGAAFDPQRNLRFSSRITYSATTMTTSGCILGGLLCRSVNWTKVSSR